MDDSFAFIEREPRKSHKGRTIRCEYYVTSDGHVFAYDGFYDVIREVRQELSSSNGYYKIIINRKNYYVHRLVAQAFLPKVAGCNVVNHLDEDKLHNCVSNLEWTTTSGNMKYYYRDRSYRHSGHENKGAKLTLEDAVEVVRLLSEGRTCVDIGKMYGVPYQTISMIKLGKRYKNAVQHARELEKVV